MIADRFDYDEMARRSLGVHWDARTGPERQEFVAAFRQFVSGVYFKRIQGYNREQIRYLNERLDGNFAEVRTMLVSQKLELPVNYYLLNTTGDWRVFDVVVDGVSLVSNFRGQFNRIIRSSSYQALLEKLRSGKRDLQS